MSIKCLSCQKNTRYAQPNSLRPCMITQVDHTDPLVAATIHAICQASYAVEAALLGVGLDSFPPLKRKVEDFMASDTVFYMFWKTDTAVAVLELKHPPPTVHIQSLVVHPDHFRQGIGQRMIAHVFDRVPAEAYYVETGAANAPAIRLYERMGFKMISTYTTPVGIRKARLGRP